MTRTVAVMSLCLFSTLGTSALLGCSSDDGSPEDPRYGGMAGYAGAKVLPSAGASSITTANAGRTSSSAGAA
ncbi:MAG TPA: hypothetical protein VJV79_22565, partial [Polyangiaceae bacterium]|nr:hypothetical protein [Polyangiaceae bacterium]